MRRGKVRIKPDRLPAGGLSLHVPLGIALHQAEGAMGRGIAGVKPDRLPAGSLSLREPPGVAQHQAKSGVCLG